MLTENVDSNVRNYTPYSNWHSYREAIKTKIVIRQFAVTSNCLLIIIKSIITYRPILNIVWVVWWKDQIGEWIIFVEYEKVILIELS